MTTPAASSSTNPTTGLVEAYLADATSPDDVAAAVRDFAATTQTPLRWLNRRDVERWMASRADSESLAAELLAVKNFCRWLVEERHLGRDPAVNVRIPCVTLHRHTKEPRNLREALMLRGLSPTTVRNYSNQIRDASGFCEDRGESLASASPRLIAEYVAARPQTFATKHRIRSALTHYWAITKRKDPPLSLLRLPPRPRMVCRALEEEEAKTLALAALDRGDDPGLAVILGLFQALRREEIATLRWDCFREDGWMTITGKGGVTASIPVRSLVADVLARKTPAGPYLFPGKRDGRPVTPMCIWNWVRRVSDDAGVQGVTPHRLRHTCLATANDATGDLRSVQAFARHADPRVTAGYTRATGRRLTAVVDSVDYF